MKKQNKIQPKNVTDLKLKIHYPEAAPGFALLETENGDPVGSVFKDEDIEIAKRIEMCVNTHKEILQALRDCIDGLLEQGYHDDSEMLRDAIKAQRRAETYLIQQTQNATT